ncbi:hypothetical protein Tco_0633739 [Tanacetum coccineum]
MAMVAWLYRGGGGERGGDEVMTTRMLVDLWWGVAWGWWRGAAVMMVADYRRKCDAAEKAYEAEREKELAKMRCKELEFIMIDPSSLPAAKRAIIEMKQAEIMRKYPDA